MNIKLKNITKTMERFEISWMLSNLQTCIDYIHRYTNYFDDPEKTKDEYTSFVNEIIHLYPTEYARILKPIYNTLHEFLKYVSILDNSDDDRKWNCSAFAPKLIRQFMYIEELVHLQ